MEELENGLVRSGSKEDVVPLYRSIVDQAKHLAEEYGEQNSKQAFSKVCCL